MARGIRCDSPPLDELVRFRTGRRQPLPWDYFRPARDVPAISGTRGKKIAITRGRYNDTEVVIFSGFAERVLSNVVIRQGQTQPPVREAATGNR